MLADWITCRLFLIWFQSAGAAHLQTNSNILHCVHKGNSTSDMFLFDKKPADSLLIGFVPFIFSPHCVSLSWAYFSSMTSSCQPFCEHTSSLYATGPISKQAACLLSRKLKLFSTCSMNYIIVLHMDSVLHKRAHLLLQTFAQSKWRLITCYHSWHYLS